MVDKSEEYTDEELEEKIKELDKQIREQRKIDLAGLPDSERLAIIKQIKVYEKKLEELFAEKHHRKYQ